MDTLTQIILGAAVGQAVGHKKLGARALLVGAVCGLVPDLDVFPAPLFGEFGGWLFHRGLTHSLIFALLAGPLLGLLFWKLYGAWQPINNHAAHKPTYQWVAFAALITHALLDLFTAYGTQLLAPFSMVRFDIQAISIIDPAYTLPLLFVLLMAAVPRWRPHATTGALLALALTTLYLFFCWAQNEKATQLARAQLHAEGLAYQQIYVAPSLFQPWLRRVVVSEPQRLRIGYISTYRPQKIVWLCQPRLPAAVTQPVLNTQGGQIFLWFSGGLYGAELVAGEAPNKKILRLTDARYGLPNTTPFGFWGIESVVTLDTAGQVVAATPPVRFQADRRQAGQSLGAALADLFNAAYGQPNTLLPRQSTCD